MASVPLAYTINNQQQPKSHSTPVGTNLVNESLVSKVEIHISCANLQDRDYLSKSDPMVVMFVELSNENEKYWKEYDRTESIKDNLNPIFVKSFVIEYYFEIHQKLKFEVYDKDSSSDILKEHDYLGMVEVTLGSIVSEYAAPVTRTLLNKKKEKLNSTISFTAEELIDSKEMISLQFKAHKLDRKDLFSSSDPYLIFSRCGIEGNKYTLVYKTETVKNNQNPTWEKFTVPVTTLCNGDRHRTMKIECFDSGLKNELIGSCETTINELLNNDSNEMKSMMLINENKQHKKKGYKHSGILFLHYIELRTTPSFLDYISGGLQLCFHVAIDFTSSNGNPAHPTSLHFQSNVNINQYAQALIGVGQICEDYDTDKRISAYGFGAKVNGRVSHDFMLNFSDDPHCNGIWGVLESYHDALEQIELFGPTNFSPILNTITKIAASQKSFDKYHVLLILTDGIISDIGQTKKALIKASKLPISVIIVGVGNANFVSMDELDSDKGMLSYQGQTAERDIVQFVPYQRFSGSFAATDLAQEVLYEVPHQLVTFMQSNGIKPDMSNSSVIYGGTGAPSAPLHDSFPQQQLTIMDVINERDYSKQLPFAPSHMKNISKKKELTAKEYALLAMANT